MVLGMWRRWREDVNFKSGITRCFVKVGYLKSSVTGGYNLWTGAALGRGIYRPNKSFFPEPTATEVGLVGELFADVNVTVVRRGDDEDPDEGLVTGEEVEAV
jgi:hypothetical protein